MAEVLGGSRGRGQAGPRPGTAPTAADRMALSTPSPARRSIGIEHQNQERLRSSAHAGPSDTPSPPPAPTQRPSSAPGRARPVGGAVVLGAAEAGFSPPRRSPGRQQWGRVSLYDHEPHIGHAGQLLGVPQVLRDLEKPKHGFAPRSPEQFLKKGEGRSLRGRNRLADWLKVHPVNRDPAFQKSTGGVRLSWESTPEAGSIFKYMYDNGTIDFIRKVQVGQHWEVEWGKEVRRGCKSWDARPTELEVAKWLPIFLEGIREYKEPYRFLAIKGCETLVAESGAELHAFAVELVPPLRKALDTREPTVVAMACELMRMCLVQDPKVAEVWIYHLWQFAQVWNLFVSKGYRVDMGYASRYISRIRETIHEVLVLLEENGGPEATALIRRYSRVDPAVTSATHARSLRKAQEKPGFSPGMKPYTLI